MTPPRMPTQEEVEKATMRLPTVRRLRAAIGMICGWERPFHRHKSLCAHYQGDDLDVGQIPQYDTSLDAIYRDLVPLMASRGLWLKIRGPHRGPDRQFNATWTSYEGAEIRGYARDPSPARAVCLASLEACHLQVENVLGTERDGAP